MTDKKLKITKDTVVIYHGECTDGFGGAWSAWKKLSDAADYFGVHHDDYPPDGLIGKDIYFIDFVYPKSVMEGLKKENKRIVIIDHHKTSENKLSIADETLFDVKHSGAILAWQYFHPQKPAPEILKYIEDRDIWQWKLDGSKEVLAYFDIFDFNFNAWDNIIERFDKEKPLKKEFLKKGKLLLLQLNNFNNDIIRDSAALVEFEGYNVYSVNAPHIFASDLGHILSEKLPPMAIIWQQNKFGNTGVSLRSDGSVDVAEIAKKYGGGGHKTSAAFRLNKGGVFPWKIIENEI